MNSIPLTGDPPCEGDYLGIRLGERKLEPAFFSRRGTWHHRVGCHLSSIIHVTHWAPLPAAAFKDALARCVEALTAMCASCPLRPECGERHRDNPDKCRELVTGWAMTGER